MVVAWPGSEIAVMGPKGAVNIIFKKEISEAENCEEKAEECEQVYMETFTNPKTAASQGYIDDVIEPMETRSIVARYLLSLTGKTVEVPKRKHGNIPL